MIITLTEVLKMAQILSDSTTMQNIYTPLPMSVHFVFCLIATFIYLAQYARKGSVHYLLVMAAIDATFITQINSSEVVITCLFVAEIILLVFAAIYSHKFNKKQKELEKLTEAGKADD
jgi:hypothetical protein